MDIESLRKALRALHGIDLKVSVIDDPLLAADAIYTSDSFKTDGYDKIVGYVYSDVASATDGVVIQQCHDGDFTAPAIVESRFTLSAGETLAFSVELVSEFVRIWFKNGPTGQGIFRLFCYLKV